MLCAIARYFGESRFSFHNISRQCYARSHGALRIAEPKIEDHGSEKD